MENMNNTKIYKKCEKLNQVRKRFISLLLLLMFFAFLSTSSYSEIGVFGFILTIIGLIYIITLTAEPTKSEWVIYRIHTTSKFLKDQNSTKAIDSLERLIRHIGRLRKRYSSIPFSANIYQDLDTLSNHLKHVAYPVIVDGAPEELKEVIRYLENIEKALIGEDLEKLDKYDTEFANKFPNIINVTLPSEQPSFFKRFILVLTIKTEEFYHKNVLCGFLSLFVLFLIVYIISIKLGLLKWSQDFIGIILLVAVALAASEKQSLSDKQ